MWFLIFPYFEVTSENISRSDVPLHLYKKLLDRLSNAEKYHIDTTVVFY